MKVRAEDLPAQVEKLLAENKALKKQLDEVHAVEERADAQKLLMGVEEIGNVQFLTGVAKARDMDELRSAADYLLDQLEQNGVVVLAAINDGKVNLVVKADKDAVKLGVHAGKIVKEIAKFINGGGGGRPDMAQAGGKNPDGIGKMFDAARSLITGISK